MRDTPTIRLPDIHECSFNEKTAVPSWGNPFMCDGYFMTCSDCTWTPVHGPVEHQEILATLAQGALGC